MPPTGEVDFYDYAGLRRSFNVRLLAPDDWIGHYPRSLDRLLKTVDSQGLLTSLRSAEKEIREPIYEMIPPPVSEQTETKQTHKPVTLDAPLDLSEAPPHILQWFAYTRNIPPVMKTEKRWSVWQKHEDGRKIPYRVLSGRHWSKAERAKSDTPDTWVTFDEALMCFLNANGHLDGLSFALGDGYCGFDFDDVIRLDGTMHPQAKSWLARLGGYSEVSQSVKGQKTILRGTLDADFLGTAETGRQFKGIPAEGMATEVYDCRRFFFLTGNGSGEPAENQQAIDSICAELLARKETEKQPKPKPTPRQHSTTPTLQMTDTALLEKIRQSKQANKFDALWHGQIGAYDSASEADMALTTILMWWSNNDIGQVERLFAQSGLAKREKWDREDYRERTLAKAIRTDGYAPRPMSKRQLEARQRQAERRQHRHKKSEVAA